MRWKEQNKQDWERWILRSHNICSSLKSHFQNRPRLTSIKVHELWIVRATDPSILRAAGEQDGVLQGVYIVSPGWRGKVPRVEHLHHTSVRVQVAG